MKMNALAETCSHPPRSESLPLDFVYNTNRRNSRYSLAIDRYSLPKNVFPIREESSTKSKLNGHQIMILALLAYGNFWVAACVSLQAPFFPQEAELKGKCLN